jgi:hypothetical protein
MSETQKKRHHYVPVGYLTRFCDSMGRVFAYRKDEPDPPLHVRPSEIGFEKYYYSQPLPNGGQDNNTLENLFSTVETFWPGLVNDLTARRDVGDRMETLFQFMSLLRVRVPAARDAIELHLAHQVRRTLVSLLARGDIPPVPASIGSVDNIEIPIDPHQSIHAMVSLLQGFGRLLNYIGFEVVHNRSEEGFATSDNPVVVFDPDVGEDLIVPYAVRPPHGRVELLLPLSPRVLIRGRSELPPVRPGDELSHVEMSASDQVQRINRFVARFGYRFVFSDHAGLTQVMSEYASLSPTVRFVDLSVGVESELNLMQMVFGPRPAKPKWQQNKRVADL